MILAVGARSAHGSRRAGAGSGAIFALVAEVALPGKVGWSRVTRSAVSLVAMSRPWHDRRSSASEPMRAGHARTWRYHGPTMLQDAQGRKRRG
ncbi:hypothetical protein HD596_009355 [Nonomuraea jabiensis]|uniref:Uncharacterized protein n=1 Tax=Nonomuraea jabiensis TaxID=882448 RepID=A0A7W9GEZ8_9ACTN|nr:hypothetical protein [Nonomuraea jabiensis]